MAAGGVIVIDSTRGGSLSVGRFSLAAEHAASKKAAIHSAERRARQYWTDRLRMWKLTHGAYYSSRFVTWMWAVLLKTAAKNVDTPPVHPSGRI